MSEVQSGEPVAAANGDAQVLQMEIGELFLEPAELSAEPGALAIEVRNTGSPEHNLAIEGVGATPMIPPGETATLEVDAIEAGWMFGMVTALIVD